MGRDTRCSICGKETDGHYEIGYNNRAECAECFGEDFLIPDEVKITGIERHHINDDCF